MKTEKLMILTVDVDQKLDAEAVESVVKVVLPKGSVLVFVAVSELVYTRGGFA